MRKRLVAAMRRLFLLENIYMFERSLHENVPCGILRLPEELSARIAADPLEVNNFFSEGYDMSACPYPEKIRERVGRGALLFLVFFKKELAHASWFFVDNRTPPFDGSFKKMATHDAESGYIGPCYTKPRFRGRGIYPYVLQEISVYLRKAGKRRALINTKKEHPSSWKGISKAGFKAIRRFRHIKILKADLYYNFKDIDSR